MHHQSSDSNQQSETEHNRQPENNRVKDEPLSAFLSSKKDYRSDIELLRKIADGDEASVGKLYDKHSGLLFSIISRVVRDENEAEDVLQDVFIRIWEKAGLYNESFGPPIVWMCRLTRNLSIDRIRSKAYRTRMSESDIDSHLELFTHEKESQPQEKAEQSEAFAAISQALNSLTNDQRQLIEYAYFQGYSQSELADFFGLPLGTVKTRIRAAMSVLKIQLKDFAI